MVAALLAEANSIKQDYADIVSADYPNLKTLDSICQITPDRLVEHAKALQTFRERWALLRKEYAARLECTNSVEDLLRNMSLADMSYGADLVKSMVESFRNELTQVSLAQKDVLNLDDQMNAAAESHRKHPADTRWRLSVTSTTRGLLAGKPRRGGRRKKDAT